MNLQDYLTQQEGKDWEAMVAAWKWLLPEQFTIWLVNRFGDMVLVRDDGAVLFFDTGAGRIEEVASSRNQFASLVNDPEKFDRWFLPGLVDHLKQSGMLLQEDQCYGYRQPPGLGGSYSPDNIEPTNLDVHYTLLGQIYEQIKDVPDGTQIRIRPKS